VGFVVGKVALGEVFLFFPVSIITPRHFGGSSEILSHPIDMNTNNNIFPSPVPGEKGVNLVYTATSLSLRASI
jgi:hypothetical protein